MQKAFGTYNLIKTIISNISCVVLFYFKKLMQQLTRWKKHEYSSKLFNGRGRIFFYFGFYLGCLNLPTKRRLNFLWRIVFVHEGIGLCKPSCNNGGAKRPHKEITGLDSHLFRGNASRNECCILTDGQQYQTHNFLKLPKIFKI